MRWVVSLKLRIIFISKGKNRRGHRASLLSMKSDRRHALWTDLDYPHFITAVTKDRKKIFSDGVCAKFLIDEWKFYAKLYDIEVIAGVVMPDHFHLIIWPRGEKTFSDFMHGVKGYFSKWYGEELVRRGLVAPPIETKTQTLKIWQDSFFDYVVPSDEKLNEKIEYILQNPIEEGLAADWYKYPYIFLGEEYRAE